MKNFNELNLSNEVNRAIEDMGYTTPTEIQSKAIPSLLENKDVIGLSETGSGKTAAFSIPALERIDENSGAAQLLIVAPTRELAMQIAEEIKQLAKYKNNIKVVSVYGGDPMHRQIKQLKNAQVVVGTPGRLQDHINRRTLRLNNLKFVVLDEADEMLNMGFYEDIVQILSKTPKEKQMALFSATMPSEIMDISNRFLVDPVTVKIKQKQVSPTQIEQSFYYVKRSQKKDALSLLLQYYEPKRAIIFTNTKRMADDLSSFLKSTSYQISPLHGDMPQNIRTNVLRDFRSGQIQILIATDVAARGIDVDDVDFVFNYDLPQTNEYYVHRIGRTGRAGKDGTAITFVSSRFELRDIANIKRLTKSDIKEKALPSKEDIEAKIIQNKVKEILGSVEETVNPLAIELVDSLFEQTNRKLNDIGLSYLLAHKLIEDSMGNFELDKVDKMGETKQQRQNTEVRVSLGRNQKLRPKYLSQAICKGIKIQPKEVGDIKLFKNHSIVMLSQENAQRLVSKNQLRVNKDRATFTL